MASEQRRSSAGAAAAAPSLCGTALLVGLTAGTLDVALSLLARPPSFQPFLALFPPMLAGGASVALIFLLLSMVWSPLASRARLDPLGSRVALAVFVTLGFMLLVQSPPSHWPPEPPEWLKSLLLMALALAASITSYVSATALADKGRTAVAAIPIRAMPFLLLELVWFEWAQLYRAPSLTSALGISACAGLLVAAPATLALFAWLTGTRWESRALPLLAIAALLVPALASAYVGGASSGGGGGPAGAPGHSVRRVILISVDTLRADVLSPYNAESELTPRIGELAADSVVFRNTTSAAPWTLASLASILTGLSPSVHGLTEMKSRLPDTLPTLAEHFERAGYYTAAIVLNNLLHPRANLSQGFHEYRFLREPGYGGSYGAAILQKLMPGAFPSAPWPSTDDVTRIALEWLDSNEEKDFFLWLHYYDPHTPYRPPGRYLAGLRPPEGMSREFDAQKAVMAGTQVLSGVQRQWLEALYQAEVRYLDDNIGSLIDELKRRGLYQDSLILFTSDHGEEFWEHGAFGHGHSLYREVLAVPLMVKLPGLAHKGDVLERVSTENIAPTVLDLCGIDYQENLFSRQTLVPEWSGAGAGDIPIVSNSPVLFDKKESVTFGSWKYVRSTIGDRQELFDLERDPAERTSILTSAPESAEAGRRLLLEHEKASAILREHYRISGPEHVEFDEETLKQLKALGYVQ